MSQNLLLKSTEETELRLTQVYNTYYDEIVELSEEEEQEFPTPPESRLEEIDSAQSNIMEDERERGDSPPSANLSETDEDYDEEEDEEEEQMTQLARAHTGRPSAAPAGRGGAGVPAQGVLGMKAGATTAYLHDDDDYELSDEHEFHATGLGGFSTKSPQSSISGKSAYRDLAVNDELKELFQYISRYKPQEQELETELKPFILDYVPAIGDIDAFIKIPRPDKRPDLLGLTCLDEPSIEQSDPIVLDLHLRAITKSTAAVPTTVRSMDSATLKANPKLIDSWVKNIRDLHAHKPPPTVNYTKRMPDVEELMQVWPTEIEEGLTTVTLPSADMDLPLAQFSQLLAVILDIPVTAPPSSAKKPDARTTNNAPSTHTIEALHVMFTLYSEFENSAHFKAMDRTIGS